MLPVHPSEHSTLGICVARLAHDSISFDEAPLEFPFPGYVTPSAVTLPGRYLTEPCAGKSEIRSKWKPTR